MVSALRHLSLCIRRVVSGGKRCPLTATFPSAMRGGENSWHRTMGAPAGRPTERFVVAGTAAPAIGLIPCPGKALGTVGIVATPTASSFPTGVTKRPRGDTPPRSVKSRKRITGCVTVEGQGFKNRCTSRVRLPPHPLGCVLCSALSCSTCDRPVTSTLVSRKQRCFRPLYTSATGGTLHRTKCRLMPAEW